MKAILMSITPEWVAKILNGEKTIEIRKTLPKCDLPIDVYIYCTKDRKYANLINRGGFLTGMVVAKFTLDNWDKWKINPEKEPDEEDKEILKLSCLSVNETIKYAAGKPIYGWYIDNLVIFDKPKEISEFYKLGAWKVYEEQFDSSYMKRTEQEIMKSLGQTLTRAPQSWCYIEI